MHVVLLALHPLVINYCVSGSVLCHWDALCGFLYGMSLRLRAFVTVLPRDFLYLVQRTNVGVCRGASSEGVQVPHSCNTFILRPCVDRSPRNSAAQCLFADRVHVSLLENWMLACFRVLSAPARSVSSLLTACWQTALRILWLSRVRKRSRLSLFLMCTWQACSPILKNKKINKYR